MINLDEEIERFEKLASDYEFNLDMHQRNVMKLSVNDVERMKRNAQENRQRAEWLRELKALRIAIYKLSRIPYGEFLTYKADDIWDLFGTYFADFEQEVMDYEEVKADEEGE